MLKLLNEELDHRRLGNAPVVTSLPLSMVIYFEWYPSHLNIGHFLQKQTDRNNRNKLQVWDHLGEHHDIAVAEQADHCNHLCSLVALSSRCVGKETDSPSLCCCEEIHCDLGLVELLVCIREQGDDLEHKPTLNIFVVAAF